MPPIKLTRAQRAERDLLKQLAPLKQELAKLRRALMRNTDEAETYRWAALELFRTLQQFGNSTHVKLLSNQALEIAREAQAVILYK